MDNVFIIVLLVLLIVENAAAAFWIIKKNKNDNSIQTDFEKEFNKLQKSLSGDMMNNMKLMSEILGQNQKNMSDSQTSRLVQMEMRLKTFSLENEQRLENIRQTVERKLVYLQEDNNKQLEKIRETVDVKLQQSLDKKLNQSFELVSKRLEEVYIGIGEMKTLAVSVGDLKKIMSNVKTRGILGEIQLGSILKEILSHEQYDENVPTKKGSRNVVEFAIKLPSDNENYVYLPIDSKFPGDVYQNLLNAVECGDKTAIQIAEKNLVNRIKQEAKDINEKYISPPETTDFAVMFLPFEGLYAEVVNRGLVEVLQREYKVNIAGPSTMAALLNSLQMGFKTLAVQKRSVEVWNVLSDVKKEFENFNSVLEKTQQRITQANSELDKLVGVRSRQIEKKLSSIQKIE